MAGDPAVVAKLEELLATLRGLGDPRRASLEWKQVHRLLEKTDLPKAGAAHVVGMRDVEALAGLVDQLRTPAPAAGESSAPAPGDVPDAETCRQALKAFRKRLALTKLDEESQLSRSPLSKGTDWMAVAAIELPGEFPDAVWLELVRQGKLRPLGHGMYSLGEP
ncbi:MAG: hypothetical protein NTV86_15695 [Planctomycetota bacterium]|nr:hypothetical protein [Planctomycetota bacterium]